MILDPSSFKNTKYIRPITHIRTGGRSRKTFATTSYIYGLEMLAVLATLMDKESDLGNKSPTFYIGNNNALLAILKKSAKPTYIQAMNGLIWHRVRELNITPSSERVPSKRNIADLPTRTVKIQYESPKRDIFRMAIDLHELIENASDRMPKGLPIEPHSMANRAIVSPSGEQNRKGCSNA